MRSRLLLVRRTKRGSAGSIGSALSITNHAIPTSGTLLDPGSTMGNAENTMVWESKSR